MSTTSHVNKSTNSIKQKQSPYLNNNNRSYQSMNFISHSGSITSTGMVLPTNTKNDQYLLKNNKGELKVLSDITEEAIHHHHHHNHSFQDPPERPNGDTFRNISPYNNTMDDDSRVVYKNDHSNNSSFVVMNHSQNQWPPASNKVTKYHHMQDSFVSHNNH